MALRSRGFDIFLSEYAPPPDWTRNAREVRRALQAQSSDLIVESLGVTSRHWRRAEEFPLNSLLTVLSSYRQADEITRALIGYHYEGVLSRTDDGPEFLFAKGLEVVRELLPGADDSAKQGAPSPRRRAECRECRARRFQLQPSAVGVAERTAGEPDQEPRPRGEVGHLRLTQRCERGAGLAFGERDLALGVAPSPAAPRSRGPVRSPRARARRRTPRARYRQVIVEIRFARMRAVGLEPTTSGSKDLPRGLSRSAKRCHLVP